MYILCSVQWSMLCLSLNEALSSLSRPAWVSINNCNELFSRVLKCAVKRGVSWKEHHSGFGLDLSFDHTYHKPREKYLKPNAVLHKLSTEVCSKIREATKSGTFFKCTIFAHFKASTRWQILQRIQLDMCFESSIFFEFANCC